MSADSSGNGHRLNTIRRSITQGDIWGGFRGGHKFKRLGKLSNDWTDWHQLWFTSVDSSGNIHTLNIRRPSIPQGAFRWKGLGGHKFIWYTSVDSSGNGHRLNTIRHDNIGRHFRGIIGGQQFKRLGNVVKRLDRLGINCAHIMQMNLGMDTV